MGLTFATIPQIQNQDFNNSLVEIFSKSHLFSLEKQVLLFIKVSLFVQFFLLCKTFQNIKKSLLYV
jgi:hypothetical protein